MLSFDVIAVVFIVLFESLLRSWPFASVGASKLLADHGVDVLHAAYVLANTIPNCISVEFNPLGSR